MFSWLKKFVDKRIALTLKSHRLAWGLDELIEVEDFTDEERRIWANYLKTPVGQKLIRTLQVCEQRQNRAAVSEKQHSKYQCGWAGGWAACSSYLLSLSVIGKPQDAELSAQSPDGEAGLRETLAP
jgi:hypothetical protein